MARAAHQTMYPSDLMNFATANKPRRSLKREFEEAQRLNTLANRELLRQELNGLTEQASIYFRDFEVNGKKRYWLMPYETIDDLNAEQIECVLKHLGWFKGQIVNVETDVVP
jgi:hypothetical protein